MCLHEVTMGKNFKMADHFFTKSLPKVVSTIMKIDFLTLLLSNKQSD